MCGALLLLTSLPRSGTRTGTAGTCTQRCQVEDVQSLVLTLGQSLREAVRPSRPSSTSDRQVSRAGQSGRHTPLRHGQLRHRPETRPPHHGAVTHPRRRAAAHNGAVHRTQAQSLQHSISHTRHGPGPFLAGLLHAVPTILSARAVRTVPPVPPPAPRPTRVTARRPCTTPPRGPRVSTTRAPPGPGRRPQRAHRGPLRCRRPHPRPAGTTRTVPARESTHDRHRRRRHRAGT